MLVAAAMLAWRLLLAVVLPPFAYDAIFYHLTIVAQWIQRGEVGVEQYAECCSHYPSGTETLFAWPALFLHNDLLVDCVQIVLAVLGALAVAGLGRWAGLVPRPPSPRARIFTLTPIVLLQANTKFNDVAFAAFFLSATFFVARLLDRRNDERRPRSAIAIVAGAATGLALGTKTSGLVVAVVFASLVCIRVGVASPGDSSTLVTRSGQPAFSSGRCSRGWVVVRAELGRDRKPRLAVPRRSCRNGALHGPAAIDDYLDEPPGGERHWLVEVGRSWRHDLYFWEPRYYRYEQRLGGLGPLWSWLGGRRSHCSPGRATPAASRGDEPHPAALLVFLFLPYKWWSRFTIVVPRSARSRWWRSSFGCDPGRIEALLIAAVLVSRWPARREHPRKSRSDCPAGRHSARSRSSALARHPLRDRHVGNLFYPEYAFLDDLPKRPRSPSRWSFGRSGSFTPSSAGDSTAR